MVNDSGFADVCPLFQDHREGSVSNRLGWVETIRIWGCLRVMLPFFFMWGENILVMETFGKTFKM